MIRRITEYIIVCDGERVLQNNCMGDSTAFGSPTLADCAASAATFKWRRISKRLWLCPKCSAGYDEAMKRTRDLAQNPQEVAA